MENGEWRNGLCGGICGADNCGMCLGAWCCPCFLYGRTAERLDNFPSQEKPGLCNAGCWLMCGAAFCHLHWLPPLFKRMEERSKFGIRGNACLDCLASYFCFPCTLAQMETEVKDRAKLANQAGVGYSQPQGGMVYQAPPPPHQGYPPQQQFGHVAGAPPAYDPAAAKY